MSLSLLSLLMVDEDVPAAARAELRAAEHGPDAERRVHLAAAARSLYRDAHLDPDEARELVGLAACP